MTRPTLATGASAVLSRTTSTCSFIAVNVPATVAYRPVRLLLKWVKPKKKLVLVELHASAMKFEGILSK
jgi:hypothetical protein